MATDFEWFCMRQDPPNSWSDDSGITVTNWPLLARVRFDLAPRCRREMELFRHFIGWSIAIVEQ
jgi:hypothetical protein